MIDNARKYHIVGYTLLLIYLIPYIILGENVRIPVWDNLDSIFVWYKLVISEGNLFKDNTFPVQIIMGGIPRGSLPGELHFTTLLYWLFGPLPSYIVERFIVHISAFIGMVLLLKRHILVNESYSEWLVFGVSLCFALLPFWPYGGLSTAGLPLLFFSFLNFRSGKLNKWDYLIVFIFAFYSSLVLVGLFVLFLFVMILTRDIFKSRVINKESLYFIMLLSIFYIISNYRLFQSFVLSSDYISHRVELRYQTLKTTYPAIRSSLKLLLFGQGHSINLIFPFVFLVVILGTWTSLKYNRLNSRILFIFGFLILTSIIFGFKDSYFFSTVDSFIRSRLPIQYDRFYFISPALWYILMAVTGNYFINQYRIGKFIVISLIVLQIGFSFLRSDVIRNELDYRFFGRYSPTFKSFFAKDLFNDIKDKISKPTYSYRVASIGIHPSISQFNGFYTVDGYVPDYPLAYKHKFRKIIEGELIKNDRIRSYFDNWGSRAYLFTAQDYKQMCTKDFARDKELSNLNLDIQSLIDLDCHYILSALEIDEESSNGLCLIQKFEHQDSSWDIWLYEVNSPQEAYH